jgi:hypothetical protein
MDPDVVLTVGFVTYAVLVALGVGVGILIERGHRDASVDDGVRRRPRDGSAAS